MKNIVVVTGGTGFIGSNLIRLLINKTNYKFLSIDNYSTEIKKIISKITEFHILKMILKIFLRG